LIARSVEESGATAVQKAQMVASSIGALFSMLAAWSAWNAWCDFAHASPALWEGLGVFGACVVWFGVVRRLVAMPSVTPL
jgi:hypothetical protein